MTKQGLFQTPIWFNSQKINVIHSNRIKKNHIVTRDTQNLFDKTPIFDENSGNWNRRAHHYKDIYKKVTGVWEQLDMQIRKRKVSLDLTHFIKINSEWCTQKKNSITFLKNQKKNPKT